MQGIADALQGDEAPDAARRSEAISGADAPGNDVGPASRPDGAAQTVGGGAVDAAHDADPGAQADAGGATPSLASQAGAVDQADGASVMGEREALIVGDRVRVIYDSPTFKDKVGVIAAINSKGTASIALDGMASEYTFEAGEFVKENTCTFDSDAEDPLLQQAIVIVLQHNKASISLVQRHLQIGYNRAARVLEDMRVKGIISDTQPDGTRKVLKGGAA
jgi:hypothetical protein